MEWGWGGGDHHDRRHHHNGGGELHYGDLEPRADEGEWVEEAAHSEAREHGEGVEPEEGEEEEKEGVLPPLVEHLPLHGGDAGGGGHGGRHGGRGHGRHRRGGVLRHDSAMTLQRAYVLQVPMLRCWSTCPMDRFTSWLAGAKAAPPFGQVRGDSASLNRCHQLAKSCRVGHAGLIQAWRQGRHMT